MRTIPTSFIDVTHKALQFLSYEQNQDGSFMCLASKKLDDYRRADIVPAIVPTNVVLSSLINTKSSLADSIKKKAASFLLKEKSEYWSFNYWFRNSDWYQKEPYPDDVDDTFCALAALYEYNPKLFNGKVMANIITMLTSAEKSEGGPYDMWLVPPEGRDRWNDTDLVVNSNVGFFLSLQDISLPKLNAFIETSINEDDYEFPYNTIYPAIYFISRFYKGKKRSMIIDLLLSKQQANGAWENPLRTALAICSLIHFSGDKHINALTKGVMYLQKNQQSDGSWPAASFYWQMRTPQKTLYAGAASLTTALCIEALEKFEKITKSSFLVVKAKIDGEEKKIHRAVVKKVKDRFATSSNDMHKTAEDSISVTIKKDKDKQIALLAYFFRKSLGNTGKAISNDMITTLGAANMFGWMAYTIYDDFLDQEGQISLLSFANICLRESAEVFAHVLPPETGFSIFSKTCFDVIDSANLWEAMYCHDQKKIPDYGDYFQLAQKSLGHLLGPLAILFALGYKESSLEIKHMMAFFKHALIARQLNDDAHDWEYDLEKNYINAISAKLLLHVKDGEVNSDVLKSIFWQKTIVSACKDIFFHTKKAREYLARASFIKKTGFFEAMLAREEYAAKKALDERKETMKFITTYAGS